MLDQKNLLELAKIAIKANPADKVAYSYNNTQMSYADLNDTLRKELNEIAGNYNLYRENKNLVFSLIEQTIDEVLPKKVIDAYGQFAEIKTFAQGDKPIFTLKISNYARKRAKQFITKVGLAGVYEVFKLDGRSYEIPTSAFGGAAQISFEEFLDGRMNWADLVEIVMEGLDECIYLEVERALAGAVAGLQTYQKATESSFVEAKMDELLAYADSFGDRSTIYCTLQFAATMVPASGWVSPEMMNTRWANGYLASYKGHNVVVLPQSYEISDDKTTATKTFDPSYAYIIPSGEKPVKIAFEGETHAREAENYDWSREIQVYRKVGVGAIVTDNLCVYRNSSLT